MVRAPGAALGCISPGPEAGFSGSPEAHPEAHLESEALVVLGSWVPAEAQIDDLLRASDEK